MRVVVNLDLCQGHGQCEEACPEVFELRDDGFAHLLMDYPDEGLRGKVEEAERRCPAGAIAVEKG